MPEFTWQPREQRKPLKGKVARTRCGHWEEKREGEGRRRWSMGQREEWGWGGGRESEWDSGRQICVQTGWGGGDHVKPQRLLLMNFSGVAVVLVTELLLRVLIDQKFWWNGWVGRKVGKLRHDASVSLPEAHERVNSGWKRGWKERKGQRCDQTRWFVWQIRWSWRLKSLINNDFSMFKFENHLAFMLLFIGIIWVSCSASFWCLTCPWDRTHFGPHHKRILLQYPACQVSVRSNRAWKVDEDMDGEMKPTQSGQPTQPVAKEKVFVFQGMRKMQKGGEEGRSHMSLEQVLEVNYKKYIKKCVSAF